MLKNKEIKCCEILGKAQKNVLNIIFELTFIHGYEVWDALEKRLTTENKLRNDQNECKVQ